MIHNDSTPILRHPRTLGLIAFAVCTGLLGTAFYMEYVWYQSPAHCAWLSESPLPCLD